MTFLGRPLPIDDLGWLVVGSAATPGCIRELVAVPGSSVLVEKLHRHIMERTDDWFFFFSFFFFFLLYLTPVSFYSFFL